MEKKGKKEGYMIVKCMLCNKLWNEATTISVCLHTFRRNCIYNEVEVEKLKCCPACNADLAETEA